MGTLWFWLLALMIAAYVLLDGFDLGAGAIHLVVARTDEERKQVLSSIGPVWNGNEVWLIATGGVLYFAFPPLYASGFSGFYLPLMIVLWLLILRGIAIEFRDHIHSEVWDPVWDFLFCTSSLLLCVFFGAALGNVIRGVPLDASGYFFEPLWTNFQLGAKTGILDWYTILVGLLALAALIVHGALWVAMKTTGPVHDRSLRMARLIWWAVVGLIAGWAAGRIMKGGGYGVVMDIVLGIIGAVVGGWLLGVLGIHAGGFIGTILVAILGAVVLIWITRLLKKA